MVKPTEEEMKILDTTVPIKSIYKDFINRVDYSDAFEMKLNDKKIFEK